MLCHNCGGENREDYKFCVHCGTPRQPASPAAPGYTPPPTVYQGTPQPAAELPPPEEKASTSTNLFKKKGVVTALIIGFVLLCLIALAVIGFVLVKSGVIDLGGGGGNRIVIGMPNRDGEADLYLLPLGKDLERATLLAEDAGSASLYLSYLQDGKYDNIGNYANYFGGFVPGQDYVVVWYRDEDGETHVLRQAFNEDAPVEIFNSDEDFLWGYIINDGRDIFINEPVSDENRCYFSTAGSEAERITKGDNCYLVSTGAYVIASENQDGEVTITSMKTDGSDEVIILDGQENVTDYRTSFDGSRVAYLSSEDEQQIILINGRSGEEITRGESSYNIPSFFFSSQTNVMIYIAENEDGELELYYLDDAGALLVASSLYINAEISRDGRYVIYMVGDEDGEETVFSYSVSSGESIEIVQGEELTFTLEDELAERVLVAQQDGDELTLYSANLNGSDVVTLFDDNNAYLNEVFYYPEKAGIFVRVNDDNGDTSLFYTNVDSPDGYFLIEEYAALNVYDVSPDGNLVLVNAKEDVDDDPVLMVLPLAPEAKPVVLDDNEDDYPTGVFTTNSNQVVYTAQTGNNADDYEIRQVGVNGEEAPETLYTEAYLVDVQWADMLPIRYIYFNDTLESSSFCPGAATITVGSTAQDTLAESSQKCYRFTGSANQIFTFSVTSESDTVLSMYDRDGYQLDHDDDSGPGLNPRMTVSLPENGTYYVTVSAYGTGAASYTFTMEEGAGDASQGAAIPLANNTSTRDYITASDAIYIESMDYDTYGVLYWFDGTGNERVTIDVIAHSQGSSIDSYVYLFDSTMQLLMTDDDSGTEYDSQLVYTLPATGRYYILVEDLGGDFGSESDYWFDILLTR